MMQRVGGAGSVYLAMSVIRGGVGGGRVVVELSRAQFRVSECVCVQKCS